MSENYGVINAEGNIEYAAPSAQMCHDHISEVINGNPDYNEANRWVVRPLFIGEPAWTHRLNTCIHHGDDHEACAVYSGRVPCDVESEGGEAVAEVVSGYSGDPDTLGDKELKALNLAQCKIGDRLYTHPQPAPARECAGGVEAGSY